MAKIRTERLLLHLRDGIIEKAHIATDACLDVKYDISVGTDGIFYTKIKDTFEEEALKVGLQYNEVRRGVRSFTFYSDTIDGLIKKVEDFAKDIVSVEVIEDKIVIKYSIETLCSYIKNKKGEFVPNGSFVDDFGKDKGSYWEGGTITLDAVNRSPFGIQIYVEPVNKKVYRYKSGKTYTEYDRTDVPNGYDKRDKRYYLQWLAGLTANSKVEHYNATVREIDYNETIAKFFVDLFIGIFNINERIKDFLEPDVIKQIAENNQKLIKNKE